jgi:hypothetical protein
MGAYEELDTTGKLGPVGIAQLYRTVGAVARRRGFPPPSGHESWTAEATMEEAHEFLSARRSKDRLFQLYVKATDEDSFAALLHVSVLNHFRSRGRKTATGRLVRRLNDVLSADDRFERLSGDRWALASGTADATPLVRDSDLEAAAWRTDVDIVRYRPDAKHQSSGASGNDLARLAEAVLTAAAAPLEDGHLAKILGSRLGLRELPLTSAVPSEDLHDEDEPSVPDDSHASAVAAAVWAELLPDERDVLAGYDLTVEELARSIGASESSAHRARKRLEEVLRIKFVDIDDGDEVWPLLRTLADLRREVLERNVDEGGTT